MTSLNTPLAAGRVVLASGASTMKEAWEVYHDEFIREARRRSTPSPEGFGHPRELSQDQLAKAEFTAAEATAYHLVDQLHWRTTEAEDAVTALRSAGLDREKLKHTWTDFVLRRQRH